VKNLKKTVLGACGVLALALPLLTGCDETQPSGDQPIVVVETGEADKKVEIVKDFFVWDSYKVLPDCEDSLDTPCVTFDEGEWRKVYSYDPYAAVKIKRPTKVKNGWRTR
jgi:hypothetical protein